jgi:hypothetical protein
MPFNWPVGSGGKPEKKAEPQAMPEPEEAGEEDGSAVAQQHGPAHEVHIQHQHEAGMHHVHSMHPDGHEHHSDHASAEEAHEHAKKLATGGEQEPDEGWEKGE